jgi:hypothetical protein
VPRRRGGRDPLPGICVLVSWIHHVERIEQHFLRTHRGGSPSGLSSIMLIGIIIFIGLLSYGR